MSAGRRNTILAFVLTLSCSLTVAGQSQPAADSCRKFVRTFYNWYVPKAQDLQGDPLDLALKQKPSPFSAELVQGLNRVAAVAKRENDPGLDFDPVLNSQDPGDPGDSYVIVKTAYKNDVCTIELHGKFRNSPDVAIVAPELRLERGRWVIVNFHYPDSNDKQNENLLTMIKNYLAPPRTSP